MPKRERRSCLPNYHWFYLIFLGFQINSRHFFNYWLLSTFVQFYCNIKRIWSNPRCWNTAWFQTIKFCVSWSNFISGNDQRITCINITSLLFLWKHFDFYCISLSSFYLVLFVNKLKGYETTKQIPLYEFRIVEYVSWLRKNKTYSTIIWVSYSGICFVISYFHWRIVHIVTQLHLNESVTTNVNFSLPKWLKFKVFVHVDSNCSLQSNK